MRTSRRTFVWITILGLAIALLVLLQRRGDDPTVADAAGSTPQSIDATRTAQRVAPAAASAASIAGSSDQALTKCAQTVSDAEDFATMERNAASPVWAAESDDDQLVAELAAAQRKLEGSRDAEHFLAALLLEPPERRASNDATAQAKLLDLGDRASRSGSKVLAWHALRACVEAKQTCPVAHLEQSLLEADRQNAEAWALVATLRYGRGDSAGALAAMQGAARAPTSTWYWTETIALIERSLAAETAIPYPDRVGAAFGSAAAALPQPVSTMCKVESASSRAWGEACLAFGMLREEHNETDMARMMAYPLRKQALTALGDRERAAEVLAELALASAEQSAMGLEPARAAQRLQWALIQTDPGQLHAYLGAIQQFGERTGTRMFLRHEVPLLLARAGLLEREGARECVAQSFIGASPATAGQQARTGDLLYIKMSSASEWWSNTLRVGPDGMIRISRAPEIAAVGKTAGQLQREIAMALSARYRSPEVWVTLFSRQSGEELQLEFDNALKEAAERRSKPH